MSFPSSPTIRPLQFQKWIKENRHLLKPPVGNKLLWEDHEFMVFAVAGPNARTDFHVNQSEEYYYQLEGRICLRLREGEEFHDLFLEEGDMLLLPAGVPHSPQRPENTLGLVVERKRRSDERDGLLWWCPKCYEKVHGEFFHLKNIVTDFAPVFKNFFGNPELCTCKKCGYQLTPESRFQDLHA
jgi:3-hydroxyanthranilate 3,4-dioxygenase